MLDARLDAPTSWHDPHTFLGRHSFDEISDRIVVYKPGFYEVYIQLDGVMHLMDRTEEEGFFTLTIPKQTLGYRIYHASGMLDLDPYIFPKFLGEVDEYLFAKGVHYDLYHCLGAHVRVLHGVKGTLFRVWAPSARKVCIMGDFNHWHESINPMRVCGHSGIWELFIPGVGAYQKYKYCITPTQGPALTKSDPMAWGFEMRPATASYVVESDFAFNDEAWMKQRGPVDERPFNCYELHVGSWKKGMNYKQLAIELGSYVKEMGFTHIQLLPILEHPLDESWGYQVTGFFAPSSRYGTLDDFKFFINYLHNQNIGVILDWVPAHFPSDAHGLVQFDGSHLYEHEDPRKGFHPHWQTLIFNYGRHEVSNFLIASALFWLKECHVDGLRVDAVASMLYLDYGREEGAWIPNQHGGKENLEAIEFLKHLNSVVHEACPGVLMIAEESTSFCGVTHPLAQGGLGFDLKWNMGWMNDTLRYFSHDPLFRKFHQNLLTFGLLYLYSEKFQYVLSHDEVVHGKRSLFSKMPGDLWQRYANLRLLYGYMMLLPGKKLLFMGGEVADFEEWSLEHAVPWHLLAHFESLGMKNLVKDLNHLYLSIPAFYEKENDPCGFEWVAMDDVHNSVIAFLRKGSEKSYFCLCHFTPQTLFHYQLILPYGKGLKILCNSDGALYAGSGVDMDVSWEIIEGSGKLKTTLTLPPLAAVLFEVL